MQTKRCSRGDECVHPLGCWQPATAEYFHKSSRSLDGFVSECKQCTRADQRRRNADPKVREHKKGYDRAWRAAHGDEIRERDRRRYAEESPDKRDRRRARSHEYYSENAETIRSRVRQYGIDNADKRREYGYRYRAENSQILRERKRRYYRKNAAKIIEKTKRYALENSDSVRDYKQKHCVEKPEIYRAARLRRVARILSLPDAFTVSDWQRALDYFNGCCAVCGRPLRDLFGTHKPAADHWIPLTDPRPDNPGTVPTNIVPLCHGVGGCNNHKSNRDPIEFLETEFGKRKAKQILARIQTYFDSLT